MFEDYWTELNLLEIGRHIAEKHLDKFDVTDAIRAYDATHHTDFLITLRAYFDSNANVSKAADRMHVHGNTIRYRITRASPKNSRSTSTIRPRGYGCGSDSFRQT